MVFQPHQPCQTILGWIGAWSAIPFPLIPHLSIFSQHLSTVSYTSYIVLSCLIMSDHCVPLALTHWSLSMSAAVSFFTLSLSLSLSLSSSLTAEAWLKSAPNLKRQTTSNIACIKSSYKIARELRLKARCNYQILSANSLVMVCHHSIQIVSFTAC